jgi:CheY-like chemotaxis protein
MDEVSISKIYKRKKSDRDIFQELMPFKVKEILLIATYYDAYTIVREGQFSDKIVGEYLQLNLYAAPRFTSVATNEEAKEELEKRNFDVVIIMAGLDKESPLQLSQEIKKVQPDIPVLVLVNNNSDLAYFDRAADKIKKQYRSCFCLEWLHQDLYGDDQVCGG